MESPSIKAAFFDIDGTLYDHSTNQIPAKHQEMLHLLKAKGIKVCLCTGRALPLIENLGILPLFPWDGIVAGNGSYTFDKDLRVIEKSTIPKASAQAVFQWAKEHQIALFSAGNCAFITIDNEESKTLLHHVSCTNIPCRPLQESDEFSVISLCVADTQSRIKEIEQIPGLYVLYNLLSIDLIRNDLNKYKGIQTLMHSFGFLDHEYMAFGDALNDLEMLENASLSGAMEDGDPRVLEKIKNHVPSCRKGGLYTFLKEQKII